MLGGRLTTIIVILSLLALPVNAQFPLLDDYFPSPPPAETVDVDLSNVGERAVEVTPTDSVELNYFYDYVANGEVFKDLGAFRNGEYVMESLRGVDPKELSASATLMRAKSYKAQVNEDTDLPPGFGHERLNVELVDLDNNKESFGVVLNEGGSEPIKFFEQPLQDADAQVQALSTAVNDVMNSDDPFSTFREAKKNDQIRIKGYGLTNSLKYALMDVITSVTGFVYNLFVKKTTVITTTTYYIDEAGNVIDKKVEVEEKVETEQITIDTRENKSRGGTVPRNSSAGGGVVTVDDCEDAKKKWEELQADWRKKDCEDEKKAMEDAARALNDAKMKLDAAKLNHKAAKESMEEAKQDYINFFKNHLFHNNVEYENPGEGWGHWQLPGTDFNIYMNDDGSAVADYLKEYEEEFDKLQREFYDARKKAKETKEELERAEKNHASAENNYEDAKKAYEDCVKEKASLKEKVKEFEEEWKDCVKTLKEQEEIKNGLTPQVLKEIERADDSITSIPEEERGKSPCPEADELRRKADDAEREADQKNSRAKSHVNRANDKFKNGDLRGAKSDLNWAKDFAEQAKEKAREASDLRRKANAAQDKCDRDAERKAAEEKRREEAEEAKKKREDDKASGIGTSVRSDAAKYHEEPQEVEDTALKVGLYGVAAGKVGRECVDTCEKKLLKLIQQASGEVFTDMTWKLGIGVMKAPIDALTPEGFVGKAAQKIASHMLGFLSSDSWSQYAVEAFASEAGGVLFPKLLGDDIGGDVNKMVNELGKKSLKELMEEEGIKTLQMDYDKGIYDICTKKTIPCKGKVTLMYNPHTRYVVVLANADCCPGAVFLKYRVNQYGQAEGPESVTYIR